jgi:hypothetical protein
MDATVDQLRHVDFSRYALGRKTDGRAAAAAA